MALNYVSPCPLTTLVGNRGCVWVPAFPLPYYHFGNLDGVGCKEAISVDNTYLSVSH